MRPVILVGAGGHAKGVAAAIRMAGGTIAAVAAPDGARELAARLGVRALSCDEDILDFAPADVELILAMGMISPSPLRRNILERFQAAGFSFATVVHPSAIIDPSTRLGEGTVVMAGAVIQADCQIAGNVIINTAAVVEHDCRVGAHTHLATGSVLCGGVLVGDGVHVGAGATVIQGRRIGSNALVAAGATVIHDVADGSRVGGVPARPL